MSSVSDQIGEAEPPPFKNIPAGYRCTAQGVQQVGEEDEPVPVTSRPVLVKALSRTEAGGNWGALVWWVDLDGREHEEAIPKALFHTRGTEIAQRLAGNGLPIIPGREAILLRYLAAFEVSDKLIAASCTGWLGGAFVLPYTTINQPEGGRVVYQPEGGISSVSRAIRKEGSFQDWKEGLASASPVVRFFVCAALSGPVRFKAGVEAGGFHAYNLTSRGKTTMMQAAASVWGNGADPAIAGGDEVYIQRWNATANALEAKAEAFNDLPLIVDEIGEGDPKEFGRTIYRIIAGTGRGRAGRSGGLRDGKSWRVTVLSAGELAVSEFIESGGGRVKGGQMVRMIDIDLDSLDALFDGAKQANDTKRLCATHYGHAGPLLLKTVPDLIGGWKDFDQSVIGEANTPIESRVLVRFALVAYTGVIACRSNILPWSERQVIESVRHVYSNWANQSALVSDIDRGIMAVRDFILDHESRFQVQPHHVPNDRVGWIRDEIYHFTSSGFKEACSGVDSAKVRRALHERGLLHGTKNKGLAATIKDGGKNVNTTAILSRIFCKLPEKGSALSGCSAKPVGDRVAGVTNPSSGQVPTSAERGQSVGSTSLEKAHKPRPNAGCSEVAPENRNIGEEAGKQGFIF